MARIWPLNGPDEDVILFKAAAAMFGYEAKTLRRLIAEGRFPAPRGFGQNEYYTGDDIAAIRLLLGRWQPTDEEAPQSDEDETAPNSAKLPQAAPKRRQSASDGDSAK